MKKEYINKENFNWWCDDIKFIHDVLNLTDETYEDYFKKNSISWIGDIDVVAMLEYPKVAIELTVRDFNDDNEDSLFYYDYYCCVNDKENGWESYEGVDFGKVNPKEFTTEKELMEDMNKQLIEFCKEHNLKMY